MRQGPEVSGKAGQLVGVYEVKPRGFERGRSRDKWAGYGRQGEETGARLCAHCLYWVLRGNHSPNSSGPPKLKPDVRDFKDSEAGQREKHTPALIFQEQGWALKWETCHCHGGSLGQVGVGGTMREEDISNCPAGHKARPAWELHGTEGKRGQREV